MLGAYPEAAAGGRIRVKTQTVRNILERAGLTKSSRAPSPLSLKSEHNEQDESFIQQCRHLQRE
jgi:hypothetical protein